MDGGLPAHAFLPGGPFPHPHREGEPEPIPPPIADGDWRGSRAYLRGFTLFNAGYYWEAHEVWEGLWHAHGRRGPIADLVKGLIKLAAAGVKVRQGQSHGVRTHAGRAADCLDAARREVGRMLLGLDLIELAAIARELAERPPETPVDRGLDVARVFAFTLMPT